MKIYRNLSIMKYTDKVCLNYKILQAKIYNTNPKMFLKDEIWTFISLSLKVCRQFLFITYPSTP